MKTSVNQACIPCFQRMLLLSAALVLLGLPLAAQSSNPTGQKPIPALTTLFTSYEQEAGLEYVALSSRLLSMMRGSDKETTDILNKLSSLYLIYVEDKSRQLPLTQRIQNEVEAMVKDQRYENLMQVRKKDEAFTIYISPPIGPQGYSEALLVVINEASTFSVMGITGIISQTVINAVMDGKIGVTNLF